MEVLALTTLAARRCWDAPWDWPRMKMAVNCANVQVNSMNVGLKD